MALSILELANGDTDYISKHNANLTNIKAAIDALQSAVGAAGAGGDGSSTTSIFYEGLMSGADAIIGIGSYEPSYDGTPSSVTVATGFAYNEASDSVVTRSTVATFNMLGQTTGTYYSHVDSSGEPYYDQLSEASLYSFDYDASSGISSNVLLTGGLVHSSDDLAGMRTNVWGVDYLSADARIDGAENASIRVLTKTLVSTDITLTEEEAFEQSVVLLADGTQTTDLTLTVPAKERVYTVINNGPSNYSTTITPDGGVGYEIPGGYFAIVHVTASTATPIFVMDRTAGAAPVNEFLLLDDVSDNVFTGKAGYLARVNSGETAMELWQADFIAAAGVTFENLDANGDIGTGAAQVAAGDHVHSGVYEPAFFKNTGFNLVLGTGAAQVAAGDHAHSGVYEPAFSKNTGFNLVLGTGSGQVAEGDHTHAGGATGDVVGPASAVDSSLAAFDTTTGKLIKDSGLALNDSGSTTSDLWSADKIAAAIAAGGGGGGGGFSSVSTQSDQATVAAATGTLYVVTTGATNGTCTVNLPSPAGAGEQLGILFLSQNAVTDTVVVHPAASDEMDDSTADITMELTGQYLEVTADGDGVNWYITSKKGFAPNTYVQSSQPSDMAYGDIWIETS